ncbi:MAG: hypothetical protein J3R72DRAFT_435927 [Linnemannia gamsii]|nr:MAG: hypothetical protein J3R72DRAFT_435927 [Linnemannia gamsii]
MLTSCGDLFLCPFPSFFFTSSSSLLLLRMMLSVSLTSIFCHSHPRPNGVLLQDTDSLFIFSLSLRIFSYPSLLFVSCSSQFQKHIFSRGCSTTRRRVLISLLLFVLYLDRLNAPYS